MSISFAISFAHFITSCFASLSLSLYAYLHFTYIFLCTLCFAFQSLYLTIFLYSMAKSCLCCSPPTLRCFAVLTWGISVAKAYKWKIMASDLPSNRKWALLPKYDGKIYMWSFVFFPWWFTDDARTNSSMYVCASALRPKWKRYAKSVH